MRVNQGEVVNVTPRSENNGGGSTVINVYIDRQPIINVVNDAIASREINVMAGINI
jgi:hypothetical protein